MKGNKLKIKFVLILIALFSAFFCVAQFSKNVKASDVKIEEAVSYAEQDDYSQAPGNITFYFDYDWYVGAISQESGEVHIRFSKEQKSPLYNYRINEGLGAVGYGDTSNISCVNKVCSVSFNTTENGIWYYFVYTGANGVYIGENFESIEGSIDSIKMIDNTAPELAHPEPDGGQVVINGNSISSNLINLQFKYDSSAESAVDYISFTNQTSVIRSILSYGACVEGVTSCSVTVDNISHTFNVTLDSSVIGEDGTLTVRDAVGNERAYTVIFDNAAPECRIVKNGKNIEIAVTDASGIDRENSTVTVEISQYYYYNGIQSGSPINSQLVYKLSDIYDSVSGKYLISATENSMYTITPVVRDECGNTYVGSASLFHTFVPSQGSSSPVNGLITNSTVNPQGTFTLDGIVYKHNDVRDEWEYMACATSADCMFYYYYKTNNTFGPTNELEPGASAVINSQGSSNTFYWYIKDSYGNVSSIYSFIYDISAPIVDGVLTFNGDIPASSINSNTNPFIGSLVINIPYASDADSGMQGATYTVKYDNANGNTIANGACYAACNISLSDKINGAIYVSVVYTNRAGLTVEINNATTAAYTIVDNIAPALTETGNGFNHFMFVNDLNNSNSKFKFTEPIKKYCVVSGNACNQVNVTSDNQNRVTLSAISSSHTPGIYTYRFFDRAGNASPDIKFYAYSNMSDFFVPTIQSSIDGVYEHYDNTAAGTYVFYNAEDLSVKMVPTSDIVDNYLGLKIYYRWHTGIDADSPNNTYPHKYVYRYSNGYTVYGIIDDFVALDNGATSFAITSPTAGKYYLNIWISYNDSAPIKLTLGRLVSGVFTNIDFRYKSATASPINNLSLSNFTSVYFQGGSFDSDTIKSNFGTKTQICSNLGLDCTDLSVYAFFQTYSEKVNARASNLFPSYDPDDPYDVFAGKFLHVYVGYKDLENGVAPDPLPSDPSAYSDYFYYVSPNRYYVVEPSQDTYVDPEGRGTLDFLYDYSNDALMADSTSSFIISYSVSTDGSWLDLKDPYKGALAENLLMDEMNAYATSWQICYMDSSALPATEVCYTIAGSQSRNAARSIPEKRNTYVFTAATVLETLQNNSGPVAGAKYYFKINYDANQVWSAAVAEHINTQLKYDKHSFEYIGNLIDVPGISSFFDSICYVDDNYSCINGLTPNSWLNEEATIQITYANIGGLKDFEYAIIDDYDAAQSNYYYVLNKNKFKGMSIDYSGGYYYSFVQAELVQGVRYLLLHYSYTTTSNGTRDYLYVQTIKMDNIDPVLVINNVDSPAYISPIDYTNNGKLIYSSITMSDNIANPTRTCSTSTNNLVCTLTLVSGDNYAATIKLADLSNRNSYSFTITLSVVDAAGNTTSYISSPFYWDSTAPVISNVTANLEQVGSVSGSVDTDDIVVRFNISDNYSSNVLAFYKAGSYTLAQMAADGALTPITCTSSCSFKIKQSAADYYTVYVKDANGNGVITVVNLNIPYMLEPKFYVDNSNIIENSNGTFIKDTIRVYFDNASLYDLSNATYEFSFDNISWIKMTSHSTISSHDVYTLSNIFRYHNNIVNGSHRFYIKVTTKLGLFAILGTDYITVDRVGPEINIKFEKHEISTTTIDVNADGNYYSTAQTISLSFVSVDDHEGNGGVGYDRYTANEVSTVTSCSHSNITLPYSVCNTNTIPEGIHKYVIRVYDLLGNYTEETYSLYIDRSADTISESSYNNSTHAWTNQDITVDFSVYNEHPGLSGNVISPIKKVEYWNCFNDLSGCVKDNVKTSWVALGDSDEVNNDFRINQISENGIWKIEMTDMLDNVAATTLSVGKIDKANAVISAYDSSIDYTTYDLDQVVYKVDYICDDVCPTPTGDWVSADRVRITIEHYRNDKDGSYNTLFFQTLFEGHSNYGWQLYTFNALVNDYQVTTIDFTMEGSYLLNLKIKDEAGNETAVTGVSIKLDRTAPTLESLVYEDGSLKEYEDGTWVNFDITLFTDIVDNYNGRNGSGVASGSISYSIDGGALTVYDENVGILVSLADNTIGIFSLRILIKDRANNETDVTYTVKIDKVIPLVVAPTITSVDDIPYVSGWFKHNVKVVFEDGTEQENENGSGIEETMYKLYRGEVPVTTSAWLPISELTDKTLTPVSGTGKYTLYVKVIDNAGNSSSIGEYEFWLDQDSPYVGVSYQVSEDGSYYETWNNASWTNKIVKITSTFSDDESGFSRIQIQGMIDRKDGNGVVELFSWDSSNRVANEYVNIVTDFTSNPNEFQFYTIIDNDEGELTLRAILTDGVGNDNVNTALYSTVLMDSNTYETGYNYGSTSIVGINLPENGGWITQPFHGDNTYNYQLVATFGISFSDALSGVNRITNIIKWCDDLACTHTSEYLYGQYNYDEIPSVSTNVDYQALHALDATYFNENYWKDGYYYVFTRVYDNAGNVSSSIQGTYKIDTVNPTYDSDLFTIECSVNTCVRQETTYNNIPVVVIAPQTLGDSGFYIDVKVAKNKIADATSGVAAVKVYLGSEIDFTTSDDNYYIYRVTDESKYEFGITIYDEAGNETTAISLICLEFINSALANPTIKINNITMSGPSSPYWVGDASTYIATLGRTPNAWVEHTWYYKYEVCADIDCDSYTSRSYSSITNKSHNYQVELLDNSNGYYKISAYYTNILGMSSGETIVLYGIDHATNTTVTYNYTGKDNASYSTNNDVTVSVAVSGSFSGVKSLQYQLGDDVYDIVDNQFVATANGTYSIILTDNANNVIREDVVMICIDKTNPEIVIMVDNNLYNQNHLVSVSASDNFDGDLSSIKYIMNSNSSASVSEFELVSSSSVFANKSFPESNPETGIYYLHVYAIDAAGNEVVTTSSQIKVDVTAPTPGEVALSCVNSGLSCQEEYDSGKYWYNHGYNVTIADGSDNHSGFKEIQYRLRSTDSFTLYENHATISIDVDGAYELTIRYIDNALNVFDVAYGIGIDRTNTWDVTITTDEILTPGNYYKNKTVTYDVNIDAPLSGISKILVLKAASEPSASQFETLGTDATLARSFDVSHSGSYYVKTISGSGYSKVNVLQIGYIDDLAPTVSYSGITNAWVSTDVTVTISANDGEDANNASSDISYIEYSVTKDGENYASGVYSLPLVFTDTGLYVITTTATDNAGNESSEYIATVRIDKGNVPSPTINIKQNNIIIDASNWIGDSFDLEIVPGTGSYSPIAFTKIAYCYGLDCVVDSNHYINYEEPMHFDEAGYYTFKAYNINAVNTNSLVNTQTVRLDNVAPTIDNILINGETYDSAKIWYNAFSLVVNTVNDGLSGYNNTHYQLKKNNNIIGSGTYSTPIVVNNNGEYELSLIAYDNVGNASDELIINFSFDKDNDVLSFTKSEDNYTNQDITVTLQDTNILSPVAQLQYTLDSAAISVFDHTNAYDLLVDFSNAVINVSVNSFLNVYIRDEAGNEIVRSYEISNIDKVDPVIAISVNTSAYQQNSDAQVQITSSDGISGIDAVKYCISSSIATVDSLQAFEGVCGNNPNEDTTATINVDVTSLTTGTYYVYAVAIDNAGNYSFASSSIIRIDNTDPESSIVATVAGLGIANNNYVNDDVTVTLSAIDNHSQVNQIMYSDGGAYAVYSGPLTYTADGTYTISVYAIDNAGNQESPAVTFTFTIDKVNPSIGTITATDDLSSAYAGNIWTAREVTVALPNGSDATLLEGLYYRINNGSWTSYESGDDLAFDETGTYTVEAKAVDAAGNEAISSAFVVKVDFDSPTPRGVTLTPNVRFMASAPTISYLDGLDGNGSGFSHYEYKLTKDGVVDVNWATLTSSVTLPSAVGYYSLEVKTIDNVGHESAPVVKEYRVVSSSDLLTLTMDHSSFTNDDVTLTASSSIIASVQDYNLEYRKITSSGDIDETNYETYSSYIKDGTDLTCVVSTNGEYVAILKEYDGNSYVPIMIQTILVDIIDKDAPTIVIEGVASSWINETASITIKYTDAISGFKTDGLSYCLIEIDEGDDECLASSQSVSVNANDNYKEVTVTVSNSGEYYIRAVAADNADNTITVVSNTIKVDKTVLTAPIIRILQDSTAINPTSWIADDFDIELVEASTVYAPIANTYLGYCLGECEVSSYQVYNGSVHIDASGVYTIKAYSVNEAGTISDIVSRVVSLDNVNPELGSISINSNAHNPVVYWYSSATIAVTAGEDLHSGYNKTHYVLTKNNQVISDIDYSSPISLTADGQYSIELVAYDNVGNVSTSRTISLGIDSGVDELSLVATPTSFTNESVVVSISDTNLLSPIKYLRYTLDNAAKDTSTFVFAASLPLDDTFADASITVNENKYVNVYVEDMAGNVAVYNVQVTNIDKVAPEVEITIGTKPYQSISNGYLKLEDVDVNINVTDDTSGINLTKYCLASQIASINSEEAFDELCESPDISSSASIHVTTLPAISGTYYLYVYTLDNASNATFARSGAIRIDAQGPSITMAAYVGLEKIALNGAVSDNVTVIIEANDYESTLDEIKYSVDGINYESYSDIYLTLTGAYTIYAYATDKSGNRSSTAMVAFTIDKDNPTIGNIDLKDTSAQSYAGDNWINKKITATLPAAADATTPVNAYYSINGGDWIAYSANSKLTFESSGIYSLRVKAIDKANNESAIKEVIIKVDLDAPIAGEVTITPEEKYQLSSPTVTFTAGYDNHSGFSHYEYRIAKNRQYINNWTLLTNNSSFSSEIGAYRIEVVAVDNVGNRSEAISKEYIINDDNNAIEIELSSYAYTNDKVTLTITYGSELASYLAGLDNDPVWEFYLVPDMNVTASNYEDVGTLLQSGSSLSIDVVANGYYAAVLKSDSVYKIQVVKVNNIDKADATIAINNIDSEWISNLDYIEVEFNELGYSGFESLAYCLVSSENLCDSYLTNITFNADTERYHKVERLSASAIISSGNYYFKVVAEDRAGNITNLVRTLRVDKASSWDVEAIPQTTILPNTYYRNIRVTYDISITNEPISGISVVKVLKSDREPMMSDFRLVSNVVATKSVEITTSGRYYILTINNAGTVLLTSFDVEYIDNLAPEIVYGGVENGEWYNDDLAVSIGVRDSIDDNNVASGKSGVSFLVYKDGQLYKSGSMEAVVFLNESGFYIIEANGIDVAGNMSQLTTIRFGLDKDADRLSIELSTDDYTNDDITVTVSDDNEVSSVVALKYTFDNEAKDINSFAMSSAKDITFSDNIIVTSNGFLNIYVEDAAGNKTIRSFEITNIDRDASDIAITINTDAYQGSASAEVSISVTDLGSGVSEVAYCISSSAVSSSDFDSICSNPTISTSANISVTNIPEVTGIYYIYVHAVDNASNEAFARSGILRIDNTVPTVTVLNIAEGEFVSGTTNIIIVGEDNHSGMKHIKYSLDGVDYFTYSSALGYNVDGAYTLYVYGEDMAGNRSETIIIHFVIDSVPPTIGDITATDEDSNDYYGSSWSADIITAQLPTGSDDNPGVTQYYKINDGEWSSYQSASELAFNESGAYTLSVKAVDKAGNESTIKSMLIEVDRTAPIMGYISFDTNLRFITVPPVVSSIPGNDEHSGFDHYEYQLSKNGVVSVSWTTLTGAVFDSSEAYYELSIRAVDAVGNASAPLVKYYTIINPAALINMVAVPSQFTSGNVTISVSSTAIQGGADYLIEYYMVVGNGMIDDTNYTDTSLTSLLHTGEETSYEVGVNAEYLAVLKLYNVNVYEYYAMQAITIDNIDKDAPEVALSEIASTWSKDSVKVTIRVNERGLSGLSSLKYCVYEDVVCDDADLIDVVFDGTTDKYLKIIDVLIENTGIYHIKVVASDAAGNSNTLISDAIKVDKDAPTNGEISRVPDKDANNASYSINVSSGEDEHSGFSHYMYRVLKKISNNYEYITFYGGTYYVSSGEWVEANSLPIIISGIGEYKIQFKAVDNVGNIAASYVEEEFVIDLEKPTISLLCNSMECSSSWNDNDVTVTFTTSDDLSGVVRVETYIDNAWVEVSGASYIISASGTYMFRTVDRAGNISDVATIIINIDKVSDTIAVDYSEDSWTNADSIIGSITISNSLSPIRSIKAYVAGIEKTINDNTFNIDRNGLVRVEVTDEAGNVAVYEHTISIFDRIAPTVSVDIASGVYSDSHEINVTVEDESSSLASIRYEFAYESSRIVNTDSECDGLMNKIYTITTPDVTGEWVLIITVYDKAGNSTTYETGVYLVDVDNPVAGNIRWSDPYRITNDRNAYFEITLGSDEQSGVAKNEYMLEKDGVVIISWTEYQGIMNVYAPESENISGDYTISIRVTDNAGLTSTASFSSVIELGANPITVHKAADWTNGTVTVTFESTGLTNTIAYRLAVGEKTIYDYEDGIEVSNATYEFTGNGTYTVFSMNEAGNIAATVFVIDTIDNAGPTSVIDGIEGISTSFEFTVTVSDGQSGFASATSYWQKDDQIVGEVEHNTNEFTVTSPNIDGNWTLVIVSYDSVGNSSTDRYEGFVVDITGPVVKKVYLSDGSELLAGNWYNGNVVLESIEIEDAGIGEISQILYNDGSTWKPFRSGVVISGEGRKLLVFGVIDALGNRSDTGTYDYSFAIDMTSPVIEIDNIYITEGSTTINYNYTIIDDDESIAGENRVIINQSGLNLNKEGQYTVTITATDKAGNVGVKEFYVYVVGAPSFVVDLTDAIIEVNSVDNYIIPTAIVRDRGQEFRIQGICEVEINTHTLATYTVKYIYSNNLTTREVTKKVIIVDTTAPVINLEGLETRVRKGSEFNYDAVVIADNYNRELTYSVEGSVNTNAIGKYTITYTVTDSSGNTARESIDIFVVSSASGKLPIGLIAGGSAGGIALIGGSIFLVIKLKKKKFSIDTEGDEGDY